jgi:hypothetical protein
VATQFWVNRKYGRRLSTPLRALCVEGQHGGDVVYPYHLKAAHQEVQDTVAKECVEG